MSYFYKVSDTLEHRDEECDLEQIASKIGGITLLPNPDIEESRKILKRLPSAHRALGELKQVAASMPNSDILLRTLILQEAKQSSEIENIVTTQDELFKGELISPINISPQTKEVLHYAHAVRQGFSEILKTGVLTLNCILEMQSILERNNAGLRRTPGVTLKNEQTGEVVYKPPQHPDDIIKLMNNLLEFINVDELSDWDPLTKMAVIHHQFESIHPFYDANGRTGRMINIFYLILQGLQESPILYLSRYINANKQDYYRLLQRVRDTGEWEDWILWMIQGVEQTASRTTQLVKEIKNLMQLTKHKIRSELPRIYSQDLINSLFKYPYTKSSFLAEDLQVTRPTATKYLNQLSEIQVLEKVQVSQTSYFVNFGLYACLYNAGELPEPSNSV